MWSVGLLGPADQGRERDKIHIYEMRGRAAAITVARFLVFKINTPLGRIYFFAKKYLLPKGVKIRKREKDAVDTIGLS